MTFDGTATNAQIDDSLSAVALLHSSCQAVIEAEVQPVSSPWFDTFDQELGQAENLVLAWRRGGMLYFQSDVLSTITAGGQAFLDSQDKIDALFAALQQRIDPAVRQELAAALADLDRPIQGLTSYLDTYLGRLRDLEEQVGRVESTMRTTIQQVQAQEQQIQDEISTINAAIVGLNHQIAVDRAAVAKARSERTAGIVETIFGVLFAPITGGASLILAGIGVASIAEAEGQIDALQSTISTYQSQIAGDQSNLSHDQAIVATLNSLTLSTGLVLSDVDGIQGALDPLRTCWTELGDELSATTAKLQAATTASDLTVCHAWYTAACLEWQLVDAHVRDISNPPVRTLRVPIG